MNRSFLLKITLVASVIISIYLLIADNAPLSHASIQVTWKDVIGAKLAKSDNDTSTWDNWFLPACKHDKAIVESYSEREETDICYFSSANIKLAMYQSRGDTQQRSGHYAIKLDTDDVYHYVNNFQISPSRLVLLPDATLIGVVTEGSDLFSMFSLNDLSTKLTSIAIPSGPSSFNHVYSLDIAAAQQFRDFTGYKILTKDFAISRNNKFAIVQTYPGDLLRIDLTTREVKLIANKGANSANTDVVLTISDDGQTAAITGSTSRVHQLYADLDHCGVSSTGTKLTREQLCNHVDFTDVITPELSYGLVLNAEFDSDQSLIVHLENSAHKRRKLILSMDKFSYRMDYLALGDSYSSGEGDTSRDKAGQNFYLPGTDESRNTCHISSNSYPFILQEYWDIPSSSMHSVACSGAQVMPDFNGRSSNYIGQERQLLNNKEKDRQNKRQQALANFTPGYIPQLEFIRKYQPKLVTFTGGGNDVGFANIIRYCASPDTGTLLPFVGDCGYAQKGSELNKTLYQTIDTQYSYTKKFIEDAQAASSATKIVLIGYPQFISTVNALSPCIGESGLLSIPEISMMEDMVLYMNKMLQQVAHDTGVQFVNTAHALDGGRICQGSSYMTSVGRERAGNARETEQFHPNAAGHKRIAKIISEAGIDIHSLEDTVAPPSGYTPPNTSTPAPTGKVVRVVHISTQTGNSPVKNQSFILETERDLLSANSLAHATAFSTPTDLGDIRVGPDGSIHAELSTKDLAPGHHVLLIDGVDEDGNPVRLSQFFDVRASETDADGDGIPDSQDPCQFIEVWYDETTGENVCNATSSQATPQPSDDILSLPRAKDALGTTQSRLTTHPPQPSVTSILQPTASPSITSMQNSDNTIKNTKPSKKSPESSKSVSPHSKNHTTSVIISLSLLIVLIITIIYVKKHKTI